VIDNACKDGLWDDIQLREMKFGAVGLKRFNQCAVGGAGAAMRGVPLLYAPAWGVVPGVMSPAAFGDFGEERICPCRFLNLSLPTSFLSTLDVQTPLPVLPRRRAC